MIKAVVFDADETLLDLRPAVVDALDVDGLPKKPSPDFFAAVLGSAGCRPEEIVYVGDNYHHDVLAPAAAGMRTVWVNRGGHDLPGEIVPDLVVERLAQLPDGLRRFAT